MDLFKAIQKGLSITSQDLRKIFMELLQALDYIHQKGIAHNDIKMENILIQDDGSDLVLADFGLAR